MNLKDLPQNVDAERNLIGLCLVDKRIPKQARDITTNDFYTSFGKAVWSAFLELEENGEEIEPIAAASILKRNSADYGIAELMQTTTGMISVNPKLFVDKIRDAATRRFLMRELYDLIDKIQDGTESITNFKKRIVEIEAVAHPTGSFRSLAEILESDVREKLQDLRQGNTNRISTGFEKLNNIIGGGLSPSDVVVVAAVTSGGKSAFVLQLATNIAKQGIPVAFVSGEMSDAENGGRLLSQAAEFININSLTYLESNELNFLEKWLEALKKLPIYFDSTTSDIQSLARSLRSLVENAGIKVLVIDYLQLYKTAKNDRIKRTERIAEVSQEVKRLAMELNLAVIEVVQFNREGSKGLKPTLYDLEGSSQLEKDASLVFILDRENDSENVTLRIVKGRNVGKCALSGTFNGMKLTFQFY